MKRLSPPKRQGPVYCCRVTKEGQLSCSCWAECSSGACCVSGVQITKQKGSPEVQSVLLTPTKASGSISPPRAALVVSNPLSCEIVFDRPGPEAQPSPPARRSPCAAVWPAPHDPLQAGAARSPFPSQNAPEGELTPAFSSGCEGGLRGGGEAALGDLLRPLHLGRSPRPWRPAGVCQPEGSAAASPWGTWHSCDHRGGECGAHALQLCPEREGGSG